MKKWSKGSKVLRSDKSGVRACSRTSSSFVCMRTRTTQNFSIRSVAFSSVHFIMFAGLGGLSTKHADVKWRDRSHARTWWQKYHGDDKNCVARIDQLLFRSDHFCSLLSEMIRTCRNDQNDHFLHQHGLNASKSKKHRLFTWIAHIDPDWPLSPITFLSKSQKMQKWSKWTKSCVFSKSDKSEKSEKVGDLGKSCCVILKKLVQSCAKVANLCILNILNIFCILSFIYTLYKWVKCAQREGGCIRWCIRPNVANTIERFVMFG